MTLHQMNLFLAVCNYGSVTEAASRIHISQPTLSVAIRQLEEEFGVPLFFRYRKRLLLTEEGKKFRKEAMKIVEEADELEQFMKDMGQVQAKIDLGITAMNSLLFYPNFVVQFLKEYPSINVEMHEVSGLDAINQINEGKLNLAIVNNMASSSSELEFIPLQKARIVGCVNKTHHLANKEKVTGEMLKDEKMVFTGEKSHITKQILQEVRKYNKDVQVYMYTHQFLLMMQVIRQFNAVGFFFEELVKKYDDNLAPFTLATPLEYTHGVVWKKDSLLRNNERLFLKYCEAHRMVSDKNEDQL